MSDAEDETKLETPPPPPEPEYAFLLVDGHVDEVQEEIRALLREVEGLDLMEEFRLGLNHVEARQVLSLAQKAVAPAEAAEAEADPKKAAKGKKPAKGKKEPEPEPESAEGDGKLAEDGDSRPPLKPFNPDVRNTEVKSLSGVKCTFIKFYGPEAVARINSALGPANPEEWVDYNDTPRAIHAGGRDFNTLHTAANTTHATLMVELMDDIHEQHQALTASSGVRMTRKSHWVNPDDLFTLLFPPGMQHPRSTGRLIVFGEYGPFSSDGKLRAGWKQQHVITNRELKTMIDEIEREDLIAIFVKDKGLTEEKKQEILQGADESKNKLPNMSRGQIEGILDSLPHNSSGQISFHDLQRVIVQARKLRMQEMKKMYPDLGSGDGGGSLIRKAPPAAGRATKLGRKKGAIPRRKGIITRKIDDTEAFKIVTKFLNREAFKICEIDQGNNPALTQNVRLLRAQPDPRFDGWDDVCCLRKTAKGSFVKKPKRR